MNGITLSYFDIDGGRGEECRLALHLAGLEFTDDRFAGKDWSARKPNTPYGAVPVIEIEGKGVLAQSNAILGYLGRQYGLLPEDEFTAARHIAIMEAAEDLRARVNRTLILEDEGERREARRELAEGYMMDWAGNVAKQITGPFVAGETIGVADLKLYIVMNWIKRGVIDHVPTDLFDGIAALQTLFQSVDAHPKVMEWHAMRESAKQVT